MNFSKRQDHPKIAASQVLNIGALKDGVVKSGRRAAGLNLFEKEDTGIFMQLLVTDCIQRTISSLVL